MADDVITQVDQLSYARIQSQRCPYCGSPRFASSSPPSRLIEKVYEGVKEMVRQRTDCENCGRSWWDVFMLSHIEELEEGEE
jgi:uncharacterized protein with PIN domain